MNNKYLKRSKSKDSLRHYSPNKRIEATVFPDFSFQDVINMLNNDPIARGATRHYVDKAMEGEYSIVDRKTLEYDPKTELELDEKYMFRHSVIRKHFLMGHLFNNVFIEIVRDADDKIIALNILDSLNVKPITKPNGDPIRYSSRVPNPETGKYAEWLADDIAWIKLGDRSVGYAPVDLRALWENLQAKSYLIRYIAWLHKTGQYRVLYNFTKATDQDIEDFLTYTRLNDNDFRSPSIAKGEIDTKVLRDMKETDSLVNLLKYYDNQTLVLLRLPPVDAGIPDASGRSNADQQSNNLSTTITASKKALEDCLNFDLFPKINLGTKLIRFGPNDRFSEKTVFENIQIMSSISMTKEAMKEYMFDKGMVWKTKKLFEDNPVEGNDNPRDLDNMPSRQGKAAGEGNKPQAQVTTRPDQLKKN